MSPTLTAQPARDAAHADPQERAARVVPRRHAVRRAARNAWAVTETRWAAAAVVLFAVGGLLQLAGAPAASWWTAYLACYVAGGWLPARDGLAALRERVLDVDLLMVVAAIAAAAIGQVLDGALLIVIFATSGALEAVATQRTAASVRALLDLAPQQATRLEPDGERTVATESLRTGDLILVRPGERVGADAQVVDGVSEVDQASITGEPLPVTKQPGDPVYAGTMNGTGAFTARVSSDPHESLLARIVGLVEDASATKAARQLVIERAERVYSAGVVVVTLALVIVPLLLGSDRQETLLRAMTFMIVASPCALVLATMPPLLAAISTAGRGGVLVKSAVVMERLAAVDAVAFDKTGTLTTGRPVVTAMRPVGAFSGAAALALAAAAERDSEHPLGAAVREAAQQAGLRVDDATGFRALPGVGVTAQVGSTTVTVGAPGLLEQAGRAGRAAEAAAAVRDFEAQGHTVAVILVDAVPAAVLALTDAVRSGAPAAVADLSTLTVSAPMLLSGDNQEAVDDIGRQVGIADARGGLLPQDKVEAIRERQRAGSSVLLVGDGINDAPALAAADLGAAMGRRGSDLALDTADIVVVRDDLGAVGHAIRLARRARRVVMANLIIAAAVVIGLTVWDLVGVLPLPLGVAGHEGSTVVVGLNGLRLLRRGGWGAAPG